MRPQLGDTPYKEPLTQAPISSEPTSVPQPASRAVTAQDGTDWADEAATAIKVDWAFYDPEPTITQLATIIRAHRPAQAGATWVHKAIEEIYTGIAFRSFGQDPNSCKREARIVLRRYLSESTPTPGQNEDLPEGDECGPIRKPACPAAAGTQELREIAIKLAERIDKSVRDHTGHTGALREFTDWIIAALTPLLAAKEAELAQKARFKDAVVIALQEDKDRITALEAELDGEAKATTKLADTLTALRSRAETAERERDVEREGRDHTTTLWRQECTRLDQVIAARDQLRADLAAAKADGKKSKQVDAELRKMMEACSEVLNRKEASRKILHTTLAKCHDYLMGEIRERTLNDSATRGIQRLAHEVSKALDANAAIDAARKPARDIL